MNTHLVDVTTLSHIISTPPYTIRSLAREGTIPAYRITNRWLFDPEEVIRAIKEQGNTSTHAVPAQ